MYILNRFQKKKKKMKYLRLQTILSNLMVAMGNSLSIHLSVKVEYSVIVTDSDGCDCQLEKIS